MTKTESSFVQIQCRPAKKLIITKKNFVEFKSEQKKNRL